MITVSAPAQTTSKMLPETNNNVQWHASANISSDSDSDWEEGYAKPYSDHTLAQRKLLWKAAIDGAINTAIGSVYEDKDAAKTQFEEFMWIKTQQCVSAQKNNLRRICRMTMIQQLMSTSLMM